MPHMELNVQKIVEFLAKQGIVVSFAYGPCAYVGRSIWTVDVLTREGNSFPHPVGANNIKHAAWVVTQECFSCGYATEYGVDVYQAANRV